MKNHAPAINLESFVDYLKPLDYNRKKRMLFMLEAGLTLYNKVDYNTSFGIYPDYQNMFIDKFAGSSFYLNYHSFHFFVIAPHLFPDADDMDNWSSIKMKIIKELDLENEIFENEYELFTFGLKLKALRTISKKQFAEKSGLSITKITQIEEACFLCKISDINTYLSKGLGKKVTLNIQ